MHKLSNYFPKKITDKLKNYSNLEKILKNLGWLFADKVIRIGLGFIITVWLARYLGPEEFGILNFGKAFVALFGALSTLGLQGIVVRDIVKYPNQKFEILGTSFLLKVVGGILVFLITVVAIFILRPTDQLSQIIIAIIGFSMVFRAAEVLKYWYESQVESKNYVWVENGIFIVVALIKVSMILLEYPLIAFVWVILLEAILLAIIIFIFYSKRTKIIRKWEASFSKAKYLLNESWPLILAGVSIMIYMKIDKIMIGQMLDDKEVGVYSVAVQISEAWYFIPTIIASSVFPSIIKTRGNDYKKYNKRFEKLFEIMVAISISIAIVMTFYSEFIIELLFGSEYANAGSVLAIHIWAGVFVFMGVASSKWFLAENLQKYSFYRTLCGGVVNIILNFLWIPIFGIIGSAVATVISQAVGSMFFNLTSSKIRPLFFMQLKALTGYRIWKNLIH
jgi:PST family polysaccharide transporter